MNKQPIYYADARICWDYANSTIVISEHPFAPKRSAEKRYLEIPNRRSRTRFTMPETTAQAMMAAARIMQDNNVDPGYVHRAFLDIAEYRSMIEGRNDSLW